MFAVKVGRRTIETEDVVALELESTDGADLPSFSAGAHIDVEVRPGLVRQYSLCNNPLDQNRYRIGILKETSSRGGSVALHGVREGDILRISEPRNHFQLDSGGAFSYLLAGGIGVTPILCMAERLLQTNAAFEMHYFAKNRARAPFLKGIISSDLHSRAHFHFDDELGEKRFALEEALGAGPRDAHLYVCGPPGFIEWALSCAKRVGFEESRLHREYFARSDTPITTLDTSFEVKLASTGAIYTVAAEESVLEALRSNGIDVPRSCEQGVCGTCLTRVLSGIPDHRDCILTAQERAANNVFAPCCSRSLSAQLVIDL